MEQSNRKLRFTDKMFLFIAMFINEDILIFGTINNSILINIRLIIQVVLTFVLLIYMSINRIPLSKTKLKIFCTFSFFVILSMLFNIDFRPGYIFIIMIYLVCVLLTTLYTFDEIYAYFTRVMYVICIFSLFGYLMQALVPSVLNYFPVIENIDHRNFYFLGFTNVLFRYDSFLRNWGPFREPGVFQAFVIIALIYCLFREKKISLKKVVVFSLAIVTTFSTTGYIAYFLVLFACISARKNQMSKLQIRVMYIVIVLALVGLLYLTFATDIMYKQGYGSVFGKMFGAYENKSFSARKASIFVNIKMFLDNPIVGKGISYVDTMFMPLTTTMYGVQTYDNTNMLFIQLARYGFPMFLYTIYRYCKVLMNAFNFGFLCKGAIVCAYFVLLFGENFTYSIVINLPMFFMVSEVLFKNDDLTRYDY